VVLSWEDTEYAGRIDGDNLVIHEFAHKLDVLNGQTNGFPPLHGGMDPTRWSDAMTQAFEDLQQRYATGKKMSIDAYAIS